MLSEHPLAGGANPGARASAGPAGRGLTAWRPDLALWVSVGVLVLGFLVLVHLLRSVAPGPLSPQIVPPAETAPAPAAAETYRSGTSVVTGGVAYSGLAVDRASAGSVPGAPTTDGKLVIVKVLIRGAATAPSTASVGLVDLLDGGTDYRPLLPLAAALSNTLWQALVLKQLAPGASKRVKLFFAVPANAPARAELLVGSHASGARRLAIPAAPA